MSNFVGMKMHFHRLYGQDSPFIEQFGTMEQKLEWEKGGHDMISAKTEEQLKRVTDRLGKIREEVHNANVNDTAYRLFYLQKGSETYEQIEQKLGTEIADAVQALRNM